MSTDNKKIKGLAVGDLAPDFSLVDQTGKKFKLKDWRGQKNVLLIFYPGDDTPGCTAQLCALRDDFKKFDSQDVLIFGVNHADDDSHKKFINKYSLPFPLLIDSSRAVSKKYGAIKYMFGNESIKRSVVLINKEGKIIYLQRGLPADSEILAALQNNE